VPIQLVLGQLKIVLDFEAHLAYNGTSKEEKMQYPADFTADLKRKPICGVLSIAIIAGVSFAKATETVKKNLMPYQKRHGGKTSHEQRLKCLDVLGVKYREVVLGVRRRNLRTSIALYCKPGKTYMINTTSHVVTVKNNIVCDQVEVTNIDKHGSRRCFVRNITEVL
jgi:hypothetical protein